MDWFEKLTGFREENPEQVRENLTLEGPWLISQINGRRFHHGKLEIPTLAQLRLSTQALKTPEGRLTVREVVGDVRKLHQEAGNADAVFQAASQFNLLEMASPELTPEMGVGIYENDRTQGPACAMACGAGTIFRNYFVDLDGQKGQTASRQVDCLDVLGNRLGNENGALWKVQNGYAFASGEGLALVTEKLKTLSPEEMDLLRGALKVGVQSDTEVTDAGHRVTQVYCSALPVGYSQVGKQEWEAFARFILEATYEATFRSAIINLERKGSRKLYLTLVGGGVFGNDLPWILAAIGRCLKMFHHIPLDVRIVSYGNSNPLLNAWCRDWR